MPIVEDFIGDDSVILNWNIEHYSFHNCTTGISILSPKFNMKKLNRSSWELQLFPKGSSDVDYVACYLLYETEKAEREYAVYNIKLSLRVDDSDLVTVRESWSPHDTHDTPAWKCEKFFRRDFLKTIDLPNNILSIRCIIQPDLDRFRKIDFQELENLSKNLISLLENQSYNDLVLVTDDNTSFKVHRCIMSARWPNLLNALNPNRDSTVDYSNCDPEIKIPNTPPETLEAMIRYVYSGTIDVSKLSRDMFRTAAKLDFNTLKKNLVTYPQTYFGYTKLSIDHKIVICHLDDIRYWHKESPSFVRFIPITELNVVELVIVSSIVIDKDGDEAIDIALRFPSLEEGMPVSLTCDIFLSGPTGVVSAFKSGEFLFETKDFWHFPEPFKKYDIPDKKRSQIKMEITMSQGPIFSWIEKSEIKIFNNFTPIRDLIKLSTDISQLEGSSGCHPRDVFLHCSDNHHQLIEAHRAILWARWPHLRPHLDVEMGESEENPRITMNILHWVLKDIISYIYSGSFEEIDIETAEDILEMNQNETVPLPEILLSKCREMIPNDL